MCRRQSRARGQTSTGKTRDVLSCRTYGFIVLSWFADERRSLKAKHSEQHVLRAFFTAAMSRVPRRSILLCRTRRHASKTVTSVLATMYSNFDGAFSLSCAVQLIVQKLGSS